MPINGALYGGIQIGDYAYGVPDTQANVLVENIPRATGVVVKFLGGGLQTVVVNGWVVNTLARRRQELEEYLRDLGGDLIAQSPTTLTINGVSYTNCFFQGISPGGSDKHFDTFTVTFIRSVASVCN